jgi:hypothetical protein
MPRKPRFRNTGAGKGVKEELDAATLRHLYVELGLTQTAIADRYGCTSQFISLLVRDYGLRRSAGSEPKSTQAP